MKKLNNKGFTLLEALAAVTIMSLVSLWGFQSLVAQIKISKSITKKMDASTDRAIAAATLSPAQLDQLKTRWQWVYVPITGECKAADTSYWIARTNTREITLYTDKLCQHSAGTLNALDNSRFANDTSKTLWEVSGGNVTSPSNNLRVLLIIFP